MRMRDAFDKINLFRDHLLLVFFKLVKSDHFDGVFLVVTLFVCLEYFGCGSTADGAH